MVKVRYTGVGSPESAFAELRPFREKLLKMEHACRPFGPEALILSAVVKALDTAAFHFTRNPGFYALGDAARFGAAPDRETPR